MSLILSRRALLGSAAAGLVLPRLALAGTGDRRFLFVFCEGGWDVSRCFAPLFGTSVAMEDDAVEAEVHGIPFVDHEARPAVRAFFEDWGDRTCVINGLEVRSITHERCRRIVMTGGSATDADDWPVQLAAASDALLPHVVVSGPSFSNEHTSSVVRLGETGQLRGLLDGSALMESDLEVTGPSSAVEALEDAAVEAALKRQAGSFVDAYRTSNDQLQLAIERAGQLSLSPKGELLTTAQRSQSALTLFEEGLSRCAIVQNRGLFERGWDDHSEIERQSDHFEVLFGSLGEVMGDLDERGLLETTTLVVFSEMGRAPSINATGGKDHWTYTSAMLVGSGVAGGQVLGGFDDNLVGTEHGGVALTAAHFGATVLALGGLTGEVDPLAEALG